MPTCQPNTVPALPSFAARANYSSSRACLATDHRSPNTLEIRGAGVCHTYGPYHVALLLTPHFVSPPSNSAPVPGLRAAPITSGVVSPPWDCCRRLLTLVP